MDSPSNKDEYVESEGDNQPWVKIHSYKRKVFERSVGYWSPPEKYDIDIGIYYSQSKGNGRDTLLDAIQEENIYDNPFHFYIWFAETKCWRPVHFATIEHPYE